MSLYTRQAWCTGFISVVLSFAVFFVTDCQKSDDKLHGEARTQELQIALKNKELEIKQIELKTVEAQQKEHFEIVAKHE